ncbi:MAG: cytochrome oxidase assembly protein [Planctomycetaceae bacterium]|nr:cytochrome oxidase assembly protein [Planctomycetaceae bacterium]
MSLVCATFPLIWVGGLVTTYDAGMAVPDWPSTYGYNLFLYPWQTWLFGPWDLFIEHGHRLLGALVGLITIGFVWSVWRHDSRRWMRGASLAVLGLVLLQGGLGGARVLMDQRQLAMIHGCVGPAFFGFGVALAVMTSNLWRAGITKPQTTPEMAGKLKRLSLTTLILIYVQLVLGAQVRHIPVTASPGTFRILVFFHLLMAIIVTVHIAQVYRSILRIYGSAPALRLPGYALGGLICIQISLGVQTWVVKYGWPAFLTESDFAAGHTINASSLSQSLTVTAHVAVGSLILAFAVMLYTRAARLFRTETTALGSGALMIGLAT